MADHDPYNFEIDIPQSKPVGGASLQTRDSDDEDSMSSPSPQKVVRKTTKPAPAPSNALDKAKNFLSKTSRVRLEFSDDEDEEDTPRSKKAPSKAAKSGKGREESKSKPKPKYDDISMELSDDDDDDDGDEEEPEIPKTTKAANTKMMKDVDKSNEEKASSEDDETPKPAPVEQKSIASTKPVTSTLNDSSDDTPMQRWTPPPAASTMQTSKPQDQKEESDDDVDEVYSDVEDEISIADDTATEPPPASVQTEQKMEQQKIPAAATKSTNDEGAFNYSMDFSDDLDADNVEASREKSPPSIIQAPRQSTSPPPASTPAAPIVAATKGNDESAASYLDESFMEDEPPPAEPSTAAPLAPESSKDKDEYLEESFAESAEPCPSKPSEGLLARLDNPPLASTHTETSSSQNPTSSQVEPPRAAQPTEVETKLHDDGHLKTPTADIETSRRQHTSSLIVDATPPSEASSAPRTRRNIVIVREYQESRPDKVEMKDASTQYTGNHVQIQADLTPHQDAAIREEPPSTESPERTETQPPPPSMSHSRPSTMDQSSPLPFPNDVNFGTSMASVNTTLATSLYRHQLQQIQAQIRRKRLEADRVMREAMTYRYTSMDAAEKFVAVNRPRKLALWEALMQIDPLMSKEQAMKIEAMSKSA